MKTKTLITLTLLTLSLAVKSQHEPEKVRKIMYDSADLRRPIDTVVFENYRYIYSVKGDTNFIHWDLIKKDKLYTDYWKAAGVSLFLVNMSAMIILPQTTLQKDKYLHIGAGIVIGAGTNLVVYKLTKNKWLAFGTALFASAAIGTGKELWDHGHGGVASFGDGLATFGGGANGAAMVTIPIGHKQKVKQYILP